MVSGEPATDACRMLKRLIAGPLWFVAVWCLVDLISSFVGLPRFLGVLSGVAFAAFAMIDPFGLFWTRHEPKTLEPNTQDVVGASPVR